MVSFSVGEEVLYKGERYVISTASPRPPYQYRLLATTPEGAKVRWALAADLTKMERYTRALDDTRSIKSSAAGAPRRR
ncbi:MAG: hypothetical protein KF875_01860 [Trueperaceae bacterium]|nr:hypothetical protein [Trueperaceae bacterium]MCC6309527.1 hypothetical protein [Trueperaceae bacterium]MCO5172859.1 hypothetical protein [Trueperaceae bacterium]MCW5820203.1 hypothetical protein [Trueperaceae bacterium]